jgi:hypothetical protein
LEGVAKKCSMRMDDYANREEKQRKQGNNLEEKQNGTSKKPKMTNPLVVATVRFGRCQQRPLR